MDCCTLPQALHSADLLQVAPPKRQNLHDVFAPYSRLLRSGPDSKFQTSCSKDARCVELMHSLTCQDDEIATVAHIMLQAFEWTASQSVDGSSLGYFPSSCWLQLIQDLQVSIFHSS